MVAKFRHYSVLEEGMGMKKKVEKGRKHVRQNAIFQTHSLMGKDKMTESGPHIRNSLGNIQSICKNV